MAVTDTSVRRAMPSVGGAAGGISPERTALLQAKLPLPVILYLLAVVLPIGFHLGPLYLTTLRLLLLVMVIPLFVNLLMGKYGRMFLTDVLFVLHIVWAIAALAVNNPAQAIEQAGSVGSEFLGGYLLGRAYIRSAESFIALCRWLVFIVLCTTPFALYETQTGKPMVIEFLRAIPGVSTVADVRSDPRLGLERAQVVFAHAIHYGLFCSVAFSLAFVALKGVTSDVRRYVTSGLVAFSGFLALSSGALLAIFLQMALIVWSTVFARIRWRWWLLVGLFVLAYVVVDILSNRDPIRVFMSYATFSAHNAYWRGIIFEWGMKNVWANPIFGIGLNDWVRPFYMYSGSMDNFWLVIGVRYGFPGFLFLAIGFALSMVWVMRRRFDDDPTLLMIRRAWVFTFLGLAFTLSTVHVWTNIYSFVFFMFGAGMWLILVPSVTPQVSSPGRRQAGANTSRNPENPATDGIPAHPASSGSDARLQYSRFPASHVRPGSGAVRTP